MARNGDGPVPEMPSVKKKEVGYRPIDPSEDTEGPEDAGLEPGGPRVAHLSVRQRMLASPACHPPSVANVGLPGIVDRMPGQAPLGPMTNLQETPALRFSRRW